MFGKRDNTDKVKKKRVKLHEVTSENDIRYRGPLSFFHFQILGWLCIVLSQVALIVGLAGRIDADVAVNTAGALGLLHNAANLSLPFLLICVFAQLLNADGGYVKQIIKNAAAMAGIWALFCLVFYRYIVGGLRAFIENPGEIMPAIQTVIAQVAPSGFVAFNIFVDLFLCALSMFFLNYKPRHIFTGKSRFIFRLLGLLPIAYEIGCMVLKERSARGVFEIPIWAYPLLTVKPPMTFVLFVALALFVKTRELRFRRHGKTHEEYLAFLQTRRNSWNFSVFLAIMLVVVSIADLAVVFGFAMNEMVQSTATTIEERLSATPTPEPSALEVALTAAKQGDHFDLKAFTAALGDALPGELSDAEAFTAAIEEALQGKTYDAETLGAAFAAALQGSQFDMEAFKAALAADSKGEMPEAAATGAPPEAVAEAAATDAPPEPVNLDEVDAETLKAAIEAAIQEENIDLAVNRGMDIALAVGFGGSVYLFLLAPLVLLFSYTRKPKYPWMGMLVPVAGFALIFVAYVEGVHQILYLLPFGKVNLDELKDMIAVSASMLQ
ncbi:MAG: hypothetical protein IKQ80_10725 [Clostridia bacterium]|nr:hypothetical protein [Clostridia bacterium]